MLAIINLVGISILFFSTKYLESDDRYKKYMITIISLIMSLSLVSILDHAVLFLLFWGLSNYLLVKLIIHKKSWQAAHASGSITAQYLGFSFCMIAISIAILSFYAQTTSMYTISYYTYPDSTLTISLILMLIGIMTQSAICPFHKWLINSVNAPTTVSALMHAGLVNGGGFLLAKFFNLYSNKLILLDCIFVIGVATACLGILSKLIQPDIKKMLACSTIGQMGFMFMEFGLGLIPAAIAHILYHGFFKAYLFLRSASIIKEKNINLKYPLTIQSFLASTIISIPGIIAFSYMSEEAFAYNKTNLIIVIVAFVGIIQICLSILNNKEKNIGITYITALSITIASGLMYGYSIYTIEHFLKPLNIVQKYPLKTIHIIGITILITLWLIMIFSNYLKNLLPRYRFIKKIYVRLLNWSQADSKTITAHRNDYNQGDK
jgi:NAD(P)H-quinone oxidoreductase subunit 5